MAFTHLEVAGLQEGDCPLRASEQEAADDGRRSLYPPMFVLLRGAAHVSIDLLDGESEPLAVLSQPGECFGELVAAWPGLTPLPLHLLSLLNFCFVPLMKRIGVYSQHIFQTPAVIAE